MKLLLSICSFAVILFSILYLYQEHMDAEWRGHQLDYLDQIDKMRGSTGVQKGESYSFEKGLKQIWLPHMNRVDRCISCHVALEDPRFADRENPLKAHPQGFLERHDPEQFSCTICHDGQGRAIAFRDAAADDPDAFWNKPLLRKPFIEANCYRCHVDSLDQTPAYIQGKQRFETSGCLGCHRRDDKGGVIGPELRGIGDASTQIKNPEKSFSPELLSQFNGNRNLAFIYEAVRFPRAQPDETVMFDFRLSHEDARALTVYLKSLTAHPTGTQRLGIKPVCPLQMTDQGQKAFGLYCTACHGVNGMGGVKNPNAANDYIPKLITLSEQMFLYKKENREALISILMEYGDLLEAGAQTDFPGYFKVVAKYMSVKNTIINGRLAERKDPEGPWPINMPAWGRMIPEEVGSAVIAYLISIY